VLFEKRDLMQNSSSLFCGESRMWVAELYLGKSVLMGSDNGDYA
jgi:hypothetical protein